MKFLRDQLDKVGALFHKDGKLEQLYPLYEAGDTFFYTPGETTKGASHVRDALDLKRMMVTVVIALIPCVAMAFYNTGYQANVAIEAQQAAASAVDGKAPELTWRAELVQSMGLTLAASSFLSCVVHGALWYLPVLIVTLVVGGNLEALFAVLRKHDINEGFLVTWMLFPLILPPTIPLWQVALGIAFGVVVGKEVFGGTGMNILNPALTARAFLFFAYPGQITGDPTWVAVDGYSTPTMLSAGASGGLESMQALPWTWWDCFLGFIPGSMGETSTLACLIGAAILIVTGIASVRIMLGVLIGTVVAAMGLNAVAGAVNNPFFDVPWYWHLVVGGWAFGAVFMATEPVTAPFSDGAKLLYGLLIGVLIVLIRVVNPAYPEGVMLAILLMNCFSATLDHSVMTRNIERRARRTKPASVPEASHAAA